MCVQTLFWKKLGLFEFLEQYFIAFFEIHLQTIAKMNWWLLPVCSYAKRETHLSIKLTWGRGKKKGCYVLPCPFFLSGLHEELFLEGSALPKAVLTCSYIIR